MIVDRFEQGPFGGPDTFTKSAGPTADTIHLDLRVAGSVDLEIEGARAFLSSPPVALGGGNQLVFELLHGGDNDLILTGVGQELDNLSDLSPGFTTAALVPVPATFPLLTTALLGLIGYRARRGAGVTDS